jgi:hypothetical protein
LVDRCTVCLLLLLLLLLELEIKLRLQSTIENRIQSWVNKRKNNTTWEGSQVLTQFFDQWRWRWRKVSSSLKWLQHGAVSRFVVEVLLCLFSHNDYIALLYCLFDLYLINKENLFMRYKNGLFKEMREKSHDVEDGCFDGCSCSLYW